MRLVAEELKIGTIKILATLPVKDYEIIIGKYLAAVSLITIAILSTIVHPITVSLLGNLDWGQVIGSYVGLILLGAAFSAVGLFTSSLTRNQIIAFIIGLLICFFFFLIGKILIFVPPFLVSFAEYLSIDYHFDNISKGVIDSRDLIYYASVSFFFLCISYMMLNNRKESKRFHIGLFLSATLLVLLGILIVLNFLSYNIFGRIDLSEGKIYSLSRTSIKLVRNLENPLLIKAYFTKNLPAPYNAQSKYLKDLLDEYKAYSRGKIKYQFIDPGENRKLKMEVRAIGIPPLQFTQIQKDKYEIKEGYMGVAFIHGDKKEIIPLVRETSGLEYTITSTIKKLIFPEQKIVGFLSGHQELNIFEDNKLSSLLSSQYVVKNIELKKEEDSEKEEPKEKSSELDNLDALVIAGPKEEIKEEEKYQIDQFLMKGKTIAFLIDRGNVDLNSFSAQPVKTGLDDLLKHYGVKVDEGYVLDLQNQTIGITQQKGFFSMTNFINYPLFPIATNLKKNHPMVKGLESAVFPFAAPLRLEPGDEKGKLRVTVLVESSKKSWYKKALYSASPLQKFFPGGNDEKGPFTLAAVVEGNFKSFYAEKEEAIKESPSTRIMVVGTSRFVEKGFPVRSESNYSFFLNMIDWLVQDEALISIRSKGVAYRALKEISAAKRTLIKYGNILFMPLLYVLYGLFRWKMRLSWKKRISQIFM
jgi:gliding-associated putative ABC transporter substrate-binding component GldG